jgi:6-phosphofructokinase 1
VRLRLEGDVTPLPPGVDLTAYRIVQEALTNARRHAPGASVDVTLGYELRCARPIPFDIDYTRTLGYGAVRFLLNESQDERLREGGFMSLEDGRLQVLPFDDLRDPVTGKTRIRVVDLGSEHYQVAREYMVRLETEDLEDPDKLAELASAAGMSPDEFRTTFAPALTTLNGARAAAAT